MTGAPTTAGVVCADTSFLFSFYGADANTTIARAELARLRRRVHLTPFNEFELGNALRFAECRGTAPRGSATARLAAFAADRSNGQVVFPACDLAAMLMVGRRLSATHTLSGGHRTFDILHVAAALCLGAGLFFSFDANQRALAQAEGLTVRP